MRVAITYHYSLSFGGSERVLEVLAEMYPNADFFALFVDERFIPEKLKGRRITTSFLDRIPGAKKLHRQLLPLYPIAVESLDLSGYDLVISADGAATKGVLTDQGALHLCYCHSPSRSFWDQYATYRSTMGRFPRMLFAPVSQYMRMWDFAASQRIDGFIANSQYVADRIWKYYRRRSTVIYPPVDTSRAHLAAGHNDYYLSVGRLVAAKRIDLAVGACNRLGRRLRVIGAGSEESFLRKLAGSTIEFLGHVDEGRLAMQYAGCRALLFPADEDFGLVPIEAQAYGRPVIAYRHGGSLETVVGLGEDVREQERRVGEHATGVFFNEQTEESLRAAICRFEANEDRFHPSEIRRHATQFDITVFKERIGDYVGRQQWLHTSERGAASQTVREETDSTMR